MAEITAAELDELERLQSLNADLELLNDLIDKMIESLPKKRTGSAALATTDKQAGIIQGWNMCIDAYETSMTRFIAARVVLYKAMASQAEGE